MKTLISLILFLFTSVSVHAQQYVLLAPTSTQTITSSSSSVVPLAIDNTSGSPDQNACTVSSNAASNAALYVTGNNYDAIDAISNGSNGIGVYAVGGFAGLYAASATGSAGYFASSNSSNTSPTVVVQEGTTLGSYDLFDVQNFSGANLVQVLKGGQMTVYKGIRFATCSPEPTCNSGTEGLTFYVCATSTVHAKLQMCGDAGTTTSHNYSWETIFTF